MWPFKQRKTVRVEMKMDIALTADRRTLSSYSECSKCHHLVNKAYTKVVRHKYEHPYIEDIEERFCPNCAPGWDLTVTISWGDYRTRYYKRIPALPEAFEEINLPSENMMTPCPEPPGGPLGITPEEMEKAKAEVMEAVMRKAETQATPKPTSEEIEAIEAQAKARARAWTKAKAKREAAARKKKYDEGLEAFDAKVRTGRTAAKPTPKKARPRAKKPTK